MAKSVQSFYMLFLFFKRVFPLSIFEVDSSSPVPRDKTELQELLRTGKAIPFHKRVCSSCHGVPKSKEWIAANETDGLYYPN